MERRLVRYLVAVLFALGFAGAGFCVETETLYARCNLKVLRGKEITWVNWQASPSSIPVGTALRVRRDGSRADVQDPASGTTYPMDLGSSRPEVLEKFFARAKPDLSRYPEEVRANIEDQVARLGMSKEAVYMAMGPPTAVRGPSGTVRTNELTYEEILKTDTWIYARKRLGKNIGVAFDAAGKVDRTEGIWR